MPSKQSDNPRVLKMNFMSLTTCIYLVIFKITFLKGSYYSRKYIQRNLSTINQLTEYI